jgi:hypothetical protein
LAALAAVDVIIDETYAPNPTTYTYATFKSNFGVPSSSSLPFVQQQKVLRIDGEMAASSKGLSSFICWQIGLVISSISNCKKK